jgi:hypothetical protein
MRSVLPMTANVKGKEREVGAKVDEWEKKTVVESIHDRKLVQHCAFVITLAIFLRLQL